MDTEDPNKDWKFQKSIDHETVNLLTHMHFLHLSRGLGNFRRFEEFQEAVCQVKWKGLFNKLQALASGNKYALHDIYDPGFQIYLAGSVAYIAHVSPDGGSNLRSGELHTTDSRGDRIRGALGM
jgi:hypothetical protein